MMDAISIAMTGLTAQKQKLAVTANNIANATTGGRVPDTANPSAPASTVYQPLEAHFSPMGENGGVLVDIRQKEPGYTAYFDPTNINVNEMGLVAAPNVDYAEEFVNLLEIKTAFKANLAVIKTQEEMLGEMLDTLA